MAGIRQYVEGFYANDRGVPAKSFATSLVRDSLLDLERRMTRKLFGMNRTLVHMSSTLRRTAEVDRIHTGVFERAFGDRVVPGEVATFTSLEELLQVVPAHTLVRRHPAGDMCLILPLSVTTADTSGGRKGELFCPLDSSEGMVRCFSPYPGESPDICDDDYSRLQLASGDIPLLLPPRSSAPDDDTPFVFHEGALDVDKGFMGGHLFNVQRGIGAFAETGQVMTGDVIFMRKKRYRVTGVTGGGEPYEYMGGKDMIALDPPPSFNSKKSPFKSCPPVSVMGKLAWLPKNLL